MNTCQPRRVCLLTSVHGPFDVRIFHKEAQSLARKGYSVTIVAPHSEDTQRDGVEIKAVPVPRTRSERMSLTLWRVFRSALSTNASVFHFHDPELIPVGMLLKLLGKRVVYDVHEDVPADILDKSWIAPSLRWPIARAAAWTETLAACRFDAIVAATPRIADSFPNIKTLTVQNFPQVDVQLDAETTPYGDREPLVSYLGGISELRGAWEMIEAMSLLSESVPARLQLAGFFDPPQSQQKLASKPGWERVDFLGWLSPAEVRELLGRSCLGVVVFHPIENHIMSQPNKLFEYMSAGLPVVASDFPLWRSIIEEARCGILVDPINPAAIAEAIRWLLERPTEAESMGLRGREAVRRIYNWENEEQKLVELYAQLMSGNPLRQPIVHT
ncbi:MAG: glycosyltransferase family 4 protein [Candidatus Acidiferrales bacterium]